MKTRAQTKAWIYYTAIVLLYILAFNLIVSIVLMIFRYPISEILIALGFIAGAGLAKLLISPLSGESFE